MSHNKLISFIVVGLLIFTIIAAYSQTEEWKKGHINAVGQDFIKIDKVRYKVSPDVVIIGEKGDKLGSELKHLKTADEIMFRIVDGNIVEIRILRLSS